MAVQPSYKLQLGGYDLVSRELSYRDATGAYDAATNPGGYGGPNDARADVALFVIGQRRETTRRVTLSSAPADPLTASAFYCLPQVDGWVQTTAYAVPVDGTSTPPPAAPALPVPVAIPAGPPAALAPLMPAPPVVYERVDVPTDLFAYDPLLAELRRRYCYLDPTGQTVSFWQTVAPIELLDSAYLVATTNELVAVAAPELRARLNEAVELLNADLVPDQFNEPQGDKVRRVFDRVKVLLEGAAYQWRLGNYYAAEQNLETIDSLGIEQLLAN